MIGARVIEKVVGAQIDVISWDDVLRKICCWSLRRESRYVCICNVHSVVTAAQYQEFDRVVNEADIATPDGAPIAWMLRRLGHTEQKRINGPDLMWKYCEQAQSRDESIFIYGSTENTLTLLKAKLHAAFPTLHIAGAYSPPFRPLTSKEDAAIVDRINESRSGVVFVSLGCPKQEMWMAEHRGLINAVMIGVGAAFDYHAGTIKRAPKLMQDYALEWLYRLLSEPKRLFKRYFVTNTIFIILAAKQLIIGSRK